MPHPIAPLTDVTRVIQLAVAPVFLLTAVGTILNVLSTRLARIVDRARVLVDKLDRHEPDSPAVKSMRTELALLARRRRLVNLAITFATTTALLICVLIAVAFIASMLGYDASISIAILFVMSMGSFIATLVLFLREISLAVASTRMDPF